MKVISAELFYFKFHTHFLFEPLSAGITSITGENGSGKSSIVDAISWSLFGVKGMSCKTAHLIQDDTDPEETRVGVELILENGGQRFKVDRRIINSHGTMQCRIYDWVEDEWIEVAGPSVSHSEALIKEKIGMDEKGFSSTSFVRQKEVDNLLVWSANYRKHIVERLIGVNDLSISIQLSNDESKSLKKAADLLENTADPEQMKEELDEQRETVIETRDRITKLSEKNEEISVEIAALEEEIAAEDKKRELKKSYENKLEELKSKLKISQKNVDTWIQDLSELWSNDEHKKLRGSKSSLKDLEEDQKELDAVINDLQLAIYQFGEKKSACESILEEKPKAISGKSTKELKSLTSDLEEEINIISEKLENLLINKKTIEQHLELIDDGAEICPTCGSTLDDSKFDRKSLEEKRVSIEEEVKEVRGEIEGKNEELTSYRTELENIRYNQDLIEKQDKIQKGLVILLREEAKAINSLAANKSKLKILSNQVITLREISLIKDREELLKSRIMSSNEENKEIQDDITKIKKKIEKIALSDDYSANKTKKQELERERGKISKECAVLEEREKQLIIQGKIFYSNYKKALDSFNKYTDLTKQIVLINQSNTVLSKFKDRRLRDSIPNIEIQTSSLLRAFTEGKITGFSLSEDFVPSVEIDGTKRGINNLSGGEVSATSLAFRLSLAAISSAGVENTMLILDEVLVSMNNERVELILDTLREMRDTQIILIAHNEKIDEYADKVVSL